MLAKIMSCLINGMNAVQVEVEAVVFNGMPSFTIVGLGDTAVQESKERIRSAIKSSGFEYPQQKKIVNLAPASLRKVGPVFDLPIAISVLSASKQLESEKTLNSIFLGELALSGELKQVRGAITAMLFACQKGFERIFLPKENYFEALAVKKLQPEAKTEILPFSDLKSIISFLRNEIDISLPIQSAEDSFEENLDFDFSLIQGQPTAKRAAEISVAGGHHLLLLGPPGVGKTMLARAMIDLLPPLSKKELLETMQVYSLVNKLSASYSIGRPFRRIHHTSSLTSLVGGGHRLIPGEITLAHNGILFLDEIAEFPRTHLEALRQPLEERSVSIAKNNRQIDYPAGFTMVAAMNPCPCGFFGDNEKNCQCLPHQIINYRKKISGPIYDRIDLVVKLERARLSIKTLSLAAKGLSDSDEKEVANIKQAVARAREIQQMRYIDDNINSNAELNGSLIKKYIKMSADAESFADEYVEKLGLSARAHLHLIKTARTIADLTESEKIEKTHLMEAGIFRKSDMTA